VKLGCQGESRRGLGHPFFSSSSSAAAAAAAAADATAAEEEEEEESSRGNFASGGANGGGGGGSTSAETEALMSKTLPPLVTPTPLDLERADGDKAARLMMSTTAPAPLRRPSLSNSPGLEKVEF